ncbi:hypothetical protein PR202_gb06939 [Eleusine coracana subsp. coracana]|uniref:AB hydrolase-1 domain-containing protein n=1 Tax=Eleusine coracana subsp. coracana TaxID=191504 RepID=A0AAV5E942_ELECO|nr:hypothetical protein PR202_gb06939 [Eleusine coracana subsp. coracana]
MPYCSMSGRAAAAVRGHHDGGEEEEEVRIFYQRYGYGATKVLLIIGFAGTLESWAPQVKGLTGAVDPFDEEAPADGGGAAEGVEVCCFDNRGVGRSSVPTSKSQYTTAIMATDALALMDHLGWQSANVFGHSMGSMIASKLAAMAPERVASLALLNTTGGGYQCIPKEYVKGLSSGGMQSRHGFEGQLNACWTHKLSPKELDRIRSAGFLVLVLHGRYDVVAQLYHARRLAEKLQPAAKMVELHGGHLVSHERPAEVNMSLMELIKASKSNMDLTEWSNFPKVSDGGCLGRRDGNSVNYLILTYNLLGKLQLVLLFFFGMFYVILEHTRRVIRVLKPDKVSASTI